MKKIIKTKQAVILETAITATKADNDNRKALRALARALGVALDSVITISPRNSKGHYNTGEIAECIVRLAYGEKGENQSRGLADLTINGKRYEIKAVNRDGKPSPTKGLDPKTPTLIIANVASFERGIYQLPYGQIVWNTSNHMTIKPTLEKAKLVKAF